MSSLSVRLHDSLHDKVRELARRDHVSINQFIATAVAEKTSALLTVDYLEQRARRADPDLFARLLSRVPDVPPAPGDALPAEAQSLPAANPPQRSRENTTRRGAARSPARGPTTRNRVWKGSEPLFRGLAVHDRWDWSVNHPVIRLSFGAGDFTQPDYLQEDLADQLEAHEERAGVPVRTASAPVRLRRLITALHERTGRGVVVLVDEYDKPILDALEEPELARRNRNLLRGLYGTIKDCDAHVRFSFLTGVSRFSKAGLFSGLNNPEDLTLNPSCSALCGYTEEDLETVFAPELPGLDRAQIRRWYDGYNWRGQENVYNPYDVLLLFRQREFEAHWFETGTPAFLVNTLRERRVSSLDLEAMTGDRSLLSKFDVGDVGTEALLFQSGYLTIKGVERDAGGRARYRLGYPNQEVRQSLNESLLGALAPNASAQLSSGARFRKLFGTNDFAGLRDLIQAHFDGIPQQWHVRNDIADYEGYYASVFYSCLAALGFDVVAEDSSARGRADLTLRFGGAVYVFEFKVTELAGAGSALSQLKARGYADKYRGRGAPIHLVGIEFSRETRTVAAFDVAPAHEADRRFRLPPTAGLRPLSGGGCAPAQ